MEHHDPKTGQRWWVCPGPEWPPDDETCGQRMPTPGRCAGCTRKRTLHRKEAARNRRRLAAARKPRYEAA